MSKHYDGAANQCKNQYLKEKEKLKEIIFNLLKTLFSKKSEASDEKLPFDAMDQLKSAVDGIKGKIFLVFIENSLFYIKR